MHAEPGAPIRLPAGVTGFEGDSTIFSAGATVKAPSRTGVFFLRRGEERVGALVVNPEREESRLDRLSGPELTARLRGREVVVTADPSEVTQHAFDASNQRPLQAILLLLVDAPLASNPEVLSIVLFLAFVKLIRLTIYIVMGAVFVQALLSWVNPYHPVAPFFDALTRPFLKPFRRAIPPIGGVDITPVLVLIAGQLLIMLPVTWLELEAVRMIGRALL